jgi:beta-lactamase class A
MGALAAVACVSLALALGSGARAQAPPAPTPTTTPSDLALGRIDALLSTGRARPEWFAASFLKAVTVGQLDAILSQLREALGPYRSTEGGAGIYRAHFEKGVDEVRITLDAQGAIEGLFFRPPQLQAASLGDALPLLQRASGGSTLSFVLLRDGAVAGSQSPDAVMAVGSTFKVSVLAALAGEVTAGRRSWSDIVPLDAHRKSLPSGVLQTWPGGTPITLATYALQMISISDNTAADTLLELVRPRLAKYAYGNDPFPSTRAVFVLRDPKNRDLLDRWNAGAALAERSTVLSETARRPLPTAEAFAASAPGDLSVEWHYSVLQLCALMREVAALPAMRVNPGVADATAFERVAYKGGSEPGVLNLTTQVRTHAGATYCFSATLNDPAHRIDEPAFELAYSTVLASLAER